MALHFTEKSVGWKEWWDPNNPATIDYCMLFLQGIISGWNAKTTHGITTSSRDEAVKSIKVHLGKDHDVCYFCSPEDFERDSELTPRIHQIIQTFSPGHVCRPTLLTCWQVLLWQADAQTLPQDGWFDRGYEGIHCWLNAKAASLLQIWRSTTSQDFSVSDSSHQIITIRVTNFGKCNEVISDSS